MTHPLLLVERHFSERARELITLEVRVVAKSSVAARSIRNPPHNFSATHDRASAVDECRRAHIPGRPVMVICERPEQQRVVFSVESIPGQIWPTAPALTAHPRSTAEGSRFQAG